MAEFKLVIGIPEAKRTVTKAVKETQADPLIGLKIGDKVSGDKIGFDGYEFQITGGSDYCGFPLRQGISGLRRKSLLIGKSVGCAGKERKLRKHTKPRSRDGFRRKKLVCPEQIMEKTIQINMKVLKMGAAPLFEAKAEEPKAAA
ncbi:MAG: S6e family ribosomal protein [Candidatus Woesearchaeota archaeon]